MSETSSAPNSPLTPGNEVLHRTQPSLSPASTPASGGNLAHVMQGRRRPPRARPYLRLLWIIPSAAVLAAGLYGYLNFEPGGTVDSVRLTTKPGMVGQVSESLRLVTGTYDLYLKVKTAQGELRTETYKGKAIGNGLIWTLPRSQQYKLADIQVVDVWDEHTFRSDKNLDHITLGGAWFAEGQTFRVDLLGKANEPAPWALPTLSVGATLTALVILRFVWDQVV